MIQYCREKVHVVDSNRNKWSLSYTVTNILSKCIPTLCCHRFPRHPQSRYIPALQDLASLISREMYKSQTSSLCNFLYSAFSLSQIPWSFDFFIQRRGDANTNRIIVLYVLNLTVSESRLGENSCKLNNSKLKTEHTFLNHPVPINEMWTKNLLFFSRQV